MHAAASSPLGASNPRREGPPDLRLVAPALAAWAGAALTAQVGTAAAVAVLAAVAATSAVLAGRRPGLSLAVGAALLCGVTGAGSAALAAADLTRGPVPELARHRSTAQVVLRVTGDPSRAGGGPTARPLAVVPAVVERVGPVRVRSQVVVMASDRLDAWLRLVPSSRLRAAARFAPDDRGQTAALVRISGAPSVVAGPNSAQRVAAGLRAGLRKAAAPLPADARALLPGLVVGDTSAVPEDLADAFRATDLAHLTAVSGGNLTVLLVLLIGPPGLAARPERKGLAARLGLPLRWTAVAGAALTLGFVLVCRPDPSVLRAAACGLVTLLAVGTGRRRSLLPALAAAVLLLVLYQPGLATSPGFVLSVLATGSLLVLAPPWAEALRRRGVPPRLAEGVAVAAAAQAACGPLIVLLSARVSLVGVPCNLLAEPAVGPATVLGFGATLAAPVAPPAAAALAWVAGWPAWWVAAVARRGAALPGADVGWPGGWPGAALLALVTLAAVCCGRWLLHRPWVCAALALALLLALLRPLPVPRMTASWPPGDWRFAMCDVGQGDALALSTGPGAAVLVDTGPDPAPVDRCLRALRVRTVPVLVLTHFDADHVDGLPGVLRGRRVGEIETTLLDEPARGVARVRGQAAASGVPVRRVVPGEEQRAGPLSWQVLWPPPEGLPDAESNDASIVLLVRDGGLRLLLLGDAEPPVQEELLARNPDLPPVDVLKVAHHGSAYQSAALLARVRPRLALISVGAGNPYGHPAARTVRALRGFGATVLRTDEDGPIAVTGDSSADLSTTFVPKGTAHPDGPLAGPG
nr:ComEC/Rec2 family competence protein [Actinacidiphila yeochonensis]